MSEPVLTAHEALKWSETTAAGWRKLLTTQPAILALPCTIALTTTVAQLLQHIVAVELRYAERILGQPETPFEQVPYDSVDVLFATHDRATALLNQALAANLDWDRTIEFATRSYGSLRASLKTILFHTVFHGIRHYAQLATLIREHGYKTDWPADYLFMGVTRV